MRRRRQSLEKLRRGDASTALGSLFGVRWDWGSLGSKQEAETNKDRQRQTETETDRSTDILTRNHRATHAQTKRYVIVFLKSFA